jgi:hypothetical protein
MVFNAGLASKFANIAALEDMRYSALSWWAPQTAAYVKAMKKGQVL